jgi:hypothetical protein
MSNNLPTYLENVSNSDLVSRLATIEKMGKETAAKIKAGDRSEASTLAVRQGRFVSVSRLQVALNVQRDAWKQTKEEMRRRGIA